MYVPGWSCIFTGRWSMLDGLQMCENEPNFDSNIIHTSHTGVEKKAAAARPKDGRCLFFFSVSQVVQDAGGSWLGFERMIYPRASSAPTPPRRTAPVQKEKRSRVTTVKSHTVCPKTALKTDRGSRRESSRRSKKNKTKQKQSVRAVNKNTHAPMRRVAASTTECGVQWPTPRVDIPTSSQPQSEL